MPTTHWSLIQNYVIGAGKKLTEEIKERMTMKPGRGLTKTPHAKIQAIMGMGRNHPAISKLFLLNQRS